MGFKRTSEGRVFFQGTDEPAAAKKADFRSLTSNAAPQATQFQILTLLKSLNDKLKDGQADRAKMRAELDAYKKHVEDVEDKAARAERAYLELEGKIGKGSGDKASSERAERAEKIAEETFKELQETRKLLLEIEDKTEKTDRAATSLQKQLGQTRALGEEILKKQTGYDDLVKRLDENDERHTDLTQKVDKATAEQSRILRQIEKVAEDRTRFMRKIERIEETVIQTRDALSAKAMVLLTEQGAAGKTDARIGGASVVEQVVTGKSQEQLNFDAENKKPRMSTLTQMAIAASVLVLGVAGGWAVSQMESNPFTPESFSRALQIGQPVAPPPLDAFPASQSENESAYEPQNETASVEEATPEETLEPEDASSYTPPMPTPEQTASNDIGTIDVQNQQQLEKMLDDNPDAVAAALNNIEPGSAPPPEQTALQTPVVAAPETVQEAPKPNVAPARIQVEPKAAAPQPELANPVTAPTPKDELAKRMKPDASLTAEAKAIEDQAYAGVPEAQHDLAAIYTAGQGGVKQDYKRAGFWFREAADHGIANARYNLGVLYHQGLGVKPDIKQAIQWYKSAAELGHPEAQYNLGIAYIEGIGVSYDPKRAADNFEKAANQGIVEAAYNLGLIYENGLLGPAQPDQALKWYKTAADQGSPEAKEALEQLAKTLDIKVEDVNRVADGVKQSDTPVVVPKASPINYNPPSIAPAHSGSRQALTAQIQEQLMRDGLYPGPADGIDSAQTEDAIRSYQSENSLPVDGNVSEELLVHMLGNEGKTSVNN